MSYLPVTTNNNDNATPHGHGDSTIYLQGTTIETHLVQQILQNVLSDDISSNGNPGRILIKILNTPSPECKKEKRNFKTLPSVTGTIPISDAKQYCITKLLTFDYLQCLFQSTEPTEEESPSFAILCALMKSAPISLMKRMMRHNFLFHQNPNVSILCLDTIYTLLETQCSLFREQQSILIDSNDEIVDNQWNAMFHDWIRMDFFQCILMMLSMYSFPKHPHYQMHCHRITQIMSISLSFCSIKQLEQIQQCQSGYFIVENRSLVQRENKINYHSVHLHDDPDDADNDLSEYKENEDNQYNHSSIDLADDIDFAALRALYLKDNQSPKECNILIVGDGDLTFSNGLVSLWPHITSNDDCNDCTLNLITSTFHDIPTLIQKYRHHTVSTEDMDIANTVYRIQTASPSHQVLFGVDATDLSRFYDHYLFDRIIFNFPQTETSKGDHRLKSANQNLIFQFLKSVEPILAKRGAVFITLHINEFKANQMRGPRKDDEVERKEKNGKRYVEMRAMDQFENKEKVLRVSHDQFYTWDVSKVLTRKELKWLRLERSIPFHAHWYPGYRVTNVKGQMFDFCKAKVHIFRRILK